NRCPGNQATATERLQGAVDDESCEARDPRGGREGGSLNLIEWAQSPWGEQIPIHIAWSLLWVSTIGGLLFLVGHAVYVRYWAKPATAHSEEAAVSAEIAAHVPERVSSH